MLSEARVLRNGLILRKEATSPLTSLFLGAILHFPRKKHGNYRLEHSVGVSCPCNIRRVGC